MAGILCVPSPVHTLTPAQDQSPSLVRRVHACGLSCCRPAIRTKGLPPLCSHHLPRPAVPAQAEMEEFKPRRWERGGEGFEAKSWDGVAGESLVTFLLL